MHSHKVFERPCRIDCVVVAAGKGSRMRSSVPKQYLDLCGETVLERTLSALLECERIESVIVVLHEEDRIFETLDAARHPKTRTVTGGQERSDSVRAGVLAARGEWCLVHDAARPFVRSEDVARLIDGTFDAVESLGYDRIKGGILALKSSDTLKLCATERLELGGGDAALTERTLDRSRIYRAQTPQLFRRDFLLEMSERCATEGLGFTDEASLADLAGGSAVMLEGSALNFKITTPDDFLLAEALAEKLSRDGRDTHV